MNDLDRLIMECKKIKKLAKISLALGITGTIFQVGWVLFRLSCI